MFNLMEWCISWIERMMDHHNLFIRALGFILMLPFMIFLLLCYLIASGTKGDHDHPYPEDWRP